MMGVESTFAQNLDSRNRERTEPKKKLRKRRSIRVSRGSYLRQSSKSLKSGFDWSHVDESSESASLQQPGKVTLSDSSPNYLKSTSCFKLKKGSSQEGNEWVDVNSVVSSSCGSSDRVVLPSIVMSDDPAMHHHPSSVEVSDTSPKYLKATKYTEGRKSHYQASSHDSESSYDSSDHSRSSHYAQSKSAYSGKKSLQTLTRSPSKRAVRILFKKSSFKAKRTSLKYSQVSEDLNAKRATCSSTIKDARFPEQVELEPGQTESERISFVKVCPYHHCSLNGHCHDPPLPKKPFLRRRRQSSLPQMSMKPNSVSERSANKKKGAKKHQMACNAEPSAHEASHTENEKGKAFYKEVFAEPRARLFSEVNGKLKSSNPVDKALNGSSYLEKDNPESLASFTKEEDIPEATFELKERSLGCYSKRTEEDKSNTPAFGGVSEGHETTTSSIDDTENNVTFCAGKDNFSHTHSLKYTTKPDVQVSICGDNDSDSKPIENNSSHITKTLLSCDMDEAEKNHFTISSTMGSHSLLDLSMSEEKTNSNKNPNRVLVFGFTPAGDSEYKGQDPTRESKPALSLGVQKPQLGKGRNISMWHLIHKHMVSGLAADDGTKKLKGADEGSQVEEADMDTTRKSSDVSPDFSDSDMGTYNQDEENQDIEIRKLYAIKLVREAIEKILLPEVQDQLSENQSVTSDIVEDQEVPEKNNEAPDEDCHGENHNISGGDNIQADPRVQVHAGDNISGQEIKKSEAKLGKKSDKKSPSNWSNLKKWILLQRFTKELEKVRKLNLKKPRQLQLETEAGAEKISLRRQTVDEKKRSEEWMLDYALQQVVSQLAPTQKRKVAILVKAFETVVPPQQDSNIQVTYPKLKDISDEYACVMNKSYLAVSQVEDTKLQVQDNITFTPDAWKRSSDHVEHHITNNRHMPVVDEAQLSTDTSLKSDNLNKTSANDVPLDESERGERFYLIQSETCDVEMKSIESEEILQASDENNADNFRASGVDNRKSERENVDLPGINEDNNLMPKCEISSSNSVSGTKRIDIDDADDKREETATTANLVIASIEPQAPVWKETEGKLMPEPVVVQKFPSLDSTFNYKENEAGQSLLDKENYLNMWHSVCQHVVSSVATKVGIQLLGEEDEEVEDANKLSAMGTPSPHKATPKGIHVMAKEIHVPSLHRAEFSRSQVLKLVKEAVQEILSPEIQDDTSDALSVSSEILPEKELSEKDHSDGAKQSILNSSGLTEQNTREFDRSEEGASLHEEDSKSNAVTAQDCKEVESLDKSNSDPPKPKNWSKLKKLILLKRSIKAMERVRKLKSQPQKQLPLPSDVEPEKVDLKHQMKDERRKAEQWMLDYAVQHIVTKLTPARKRRVAMLVEAFEAVVPLPEI